MVSFGRPLAISAMVKLKSVQQSGFPVVLGVAALSSLVPMLPEPFQLVKHFVALVRSVAGSRTSGLADIPRAT